MRAVRESVHRGIFATAQPAMGHKSVPPANKESFGFLLTASIRCGLSRVAARNDVASLGNANFAVTP